MATAVLGETKLAKLFDALDTDADQVVNEADFKRVAEAYIKEFKPKDPSEADYLRMYYGMFYHELVRQSASSSEINKGEFIQAIQRVTLDTSRINLVEGLAQSTFDIMDISDNGSLSEAEYQVFLGIWGIEDPEAWETFKRLDTDGDKSISRQEYIRAWHEFFRSNDDSAPGAYFFGNPKK